MASKGTLAFFLAIGLAVSPLSSALDAQANGTLGGKATDKAKQPYSDYMVRVRTTSSTTPVQTIPLDAQGQFRFLNLALGTAYLIDLVEVKNNTNKTICTEGPYNLSQQLLSKTDVNIDCGRNPTALIIAAGAGAAIIAAATQSSSGQ